MIDGGLSTILKDHLHEWHFQRIETGSTGRGIPDLNGCKKGVEVWLELKTTEAWSVGIRPEQIAWAERRIRAGGRVFLLTRRKADGGPRKGDPVDEIWLHHGMDMRLVAENGLRDGPDPIYKGAGGPKGWLWQVIENTLLSKNLSDI